MNRRLLEVSFLVGAAAVALITSATVSFTRLGAWALGTLGPLVLVGVVVGTVSWPWRLGEVAASAPPARRPWRLLYLVPALVAVVLAPFVVRERPGGLGPVAGVAILLLVAYTALLVGLAAFLVVILPWTWLVGSLVLRLRGGRVPPYLPLAGLLLLTLVASVLCGALALDQLPPGAVGLGFLLVALLGVVPSGVTVTSTGLLVVARVALALLAATLVAWGVINRRARAADGP